jgi:hypothetical protein
MLYIVNSQDQDKLSLKYLLYIMCIITMLLIIVNKI